ncbi:hypothetical protein [Paraburkholderia tropica]|uniref:hypothetical protein n=1 Tax=Paraburkholderia tropica TaxID=92647 RepID=UPI002AB2B507|nr:hypothetical protein [Paraburkholderia tropica]
MKTDWHLIRNVLNAAIDSCEALESAGYAEEHRARTIIVNGRPVSVQEFLTSAWTLPENVRYAVIRQRHDAGLDSPYIPEAARILIAVAAACAEIVGAGNSPPGIEGMQNMAAWYRNHFDPNVKAAIDGISGPYSSETTP